MSIFRNQEVRKQVAVSLVFLLLFGGLGYFFFPGNVACIAYTIFCSLGMCLGWFFFTEKRYDRLKHLGEDMDRMLHGERKLSLTKYKEGELAILANEVDKLLLRLTEQADTLLREKRYLSDSLADISHQLRTPLTSLHLLLARIQRETDEMERRRLAYEGAQLLERLDWLVNALLKISRIDAGTAVFSKEWIEADRLVEKALEPLRIPMELHGQGVIVEIEEHMRFRGDFSWNVEALGNILKNCMEHIGTEGTLWIRGSENQLYTEFMIEDNGKGIDKEDLPHIFERFYKGKEASDSSVGIGLALSRMIVSSQNGTLKAENRKEGGARFTMRFYKGVV
ncbi:MAG: HAMP domain-containing histidine kinase [Lachnospiraceae bacterium]|jgi:signal transduction histidine kinase|nr:HAMP domain-containing histidine kinase [Lachnospiraceae bacterium]